ncbi:MAG TPA: MFS transporter [Dyella sp.]|uniref:MFS transporter n=1 Tax=Dyella sp. TaxID=1869338 RepID=UPI002D7A1CCF|nr:MFS transporter [Dyella sp.]HET6554211.1 MFS transporter [Dyella sp.]
MNAMRQSAPPAAASPWSAVVAVAVGAFALVTSEFLPVGLLPHIAHDLAITEGEAGLLVTMPAVVAAFAALGTSTLFGHADRRHVLMALLGVLGLSNAMVALSTHVALLLTARALIGAAIGSFWSIGVSMGQRLRPGADGVRAASIILSGVSIGTVAGVPAGAVLGHLLGWRWAFGACAVMAAGVFVILAAWLPPVPPDGDRSAKELMAMLRLRPLRRGLLLTLTMFVAQFGTYTYIAPFLNRVAHVPSSEVGGVLLAYGVASFAGTLLGGWLGSRHLRFSVTLTGLVIGGSVLSLAWLGHSTVAAVACVVLWGLGFGMLPITTQTLVFDAAPSRMDNVGSLFVCTAQVAIACGSFAGGLVVDHVGLTESLMLGGALSCISALFVTFSKATREAVPARA